MWSMVVAVVCALQLMPILAEKMGAPGTGDGISVDVSITLNLVEASLAIAMTIIAFRSIGDSRGSVLALIVINWAYVALCTVRAVHDGFFADWVSLMPTSPAVVSMILSNICYQAGWSIFPMTVAQIAYRRYRSLGRND